MNYYWVLLLSGIMAYCATSVIYRKVLKVAKVRQLVDNPNERKSQKVPVPVLGGIAVYFGILCSLLFAGALVIQFGELSSMLSGKLVYSTVCDLLPVLLASSVLLLVGCMDDLVGLSPRFRLVMECCAILGMCLCSGRCVDSFHGMFGIWDFSLWIGLPLTVFAGVGIINAYNMVDGVDGLSTGLCITTTPIMMAVFAKRQDWADAALVACYFASLIPFFIHNVFGKRSRMFIGDAGTMVMGTLFTWCVIQTLSSKGVMANLMDTDPDAVMCLPAMLLSMACVPVMDTLRVMVVRKLQGYSVFRADRNHLHHKFIDVGISPFVTTLSEIVLNLLVVLAWYVSYKMGVRQMGQLFVTLGAAVVLVWGSYFFLNNRENYNTRVLRLMRGFSVVSHWERSKEWKMIQRYVDKGSYEDLTEFVLANFKGDGSSISDNDMSVVFVMNYLQDRNSANVNEIVSNLNIDPLRVSEILQEIDEHGLIEVLDRDGDGKIRKLKLRRKVIFDE